MDFTFDVERWAKSENGPFYTYFEFEDLCENLTEQEAEEYSEYTISLDVEATGHYVPAKTWGLPEDCYPEDSDAEITSVKDSLGNDWSDKLTDSENKSLMSEVWDIVMSGPSY